MYYPIEKYRFVVTDDKVVALSTYAGRTVRGIAKCSPDDEFDEDYGKRLAAARCNTKVCEKRVLRAIDKIEEAEVLFNEAKEYLKDMKEYYTDSYNEYMDAMIEESTIEFESE